MLRFNPLQVFASSRTPPGLYARKKWLGEENTRSWKKDFQDTVRALLKGQSPDGSWGESAVVTIQRLFGLHLTLRERTEAVTKGLHWLMGEMDRAFPRKRVHLEGHIEMEALKGLPFTRGCSGLFLYGSTLFLSSIFGLHGHKTVLTVYERLEKMGIEREGRWCGWSCSNNVLRAFVVHPEYCRSRVVGLAVEALSRVQRQSGEWPREIPFYKTVNALAHLDLPHADVQLEAAFRRLRERQRKDGTWGRSEKEWDSFLAVHALINKGKGEYDRP